MHKITELKNVGKACKTCNLEKIELTLADEERSLIKIQELLYIYPLFTKLYLNNLII